MGFLRRLVTVDFESSEPHMVQPVSYRANIFGTLKGLNLYFWSQKTRTLKFHLSMLGKITGGGQILRARKEVLPVADYISAVNMCKAGQK